VNNLYLREGRLSYAFLSDLWLDVGTFDSLLEAANYVREHLKDRLEPWEEEQQEEKGKGERGPRGRRNSYELAASVRFPLWLLPRAYL